MDILSELAAKYRTDKGVQYHGYTPVYFEQFKNFRTDNFNFLEIGLGNITSENREGESLKMWADFFPNANIYGIDVEDKSFLNDGNRIQVFKGSQTDSVFLRDFMFTKIGLNRDLNRSHLKVVVDDASHHNPKTIFTFEEIFPYMENGGIYCIEDTVTSYWTGWQGDSNVLNPSHETVMSYFLNLCHNVNMLRRQNFHNPVIFEPKHSWYKDIKSIHFYNSQIFIYKW